MASATAPVLQAKPFVRAAEPVKQIALSEDQVTQYLAAAPALDAIFAKVPAAPNAMPDPRLMASLNAAAREYGFADYANYEAVALNIVWILTGIDPLSKKYIGVQTVTRAEVTELLVGKTLPPEEKKRQLEAYHAQMLSAAPVKFAGNVALVLKYYDQLLAPEAKD
ncbi:MAG: hypothetical protein ACLQL2_12125 [Methylovirgula sp.]